MALATGPAAAIWPFRGSKHPDPREDLGGAAATILSTAIRFDTTNPPGNERPLAEYLVGILKDEGLEAKLVESPAGESRRGRAGAWARLPGSGKRRPIVLLSHLDVVPADVDQWAVDPFQGIVGGGYVVGRGALDAKGVAVVHLLTMIELARRESPLDRDVIFLATPDEETGGRHGAGLVVRQRAELLHDAEYLLTEGGGILPDQAGRADIWGVTFVEKSPCWLELVARGTPGHGSTAEPDAAVPKLVAALERVRRFEGEIQVIPEVERMFSALAPFAPPADRLGYEHLATALAVDPEFRVRFLSEPGRAALVRNTSTITVVRAGGRTNVIPAEARAHLDARLLPGQSCADFAARIRETIADPEIALETLLAFETRSSPIDTELFHAIEAAAAEIDPRARVVPRVIAGFTDAHYFRDIGLVAYGFVPRWLPPHETRSIHGPNERISVENLERGVRTLVRILELLDRGIPDSGPGER